MIFGTSHSLNEGNQLFLLINLIINFNHNVTTSSQEKHWLLWFHACLDTLDNVLKLFVGEFLRHSFRLKIFFLKQKSCHSCNLSVLVIHSHEESINTLFEVVDWDLINKILSFSPALVVCAEQNFDDVV